MSRIRGNKNVIMSFDDHYDALEALFTKAAEFDLKFNLKKWQFSIFRTKLEPAVRVSEAKRCCELIWTLRQPERRRGNPWRFVMLKTIATPDRITNIF